MDFKEYLSYFSEMIDGDKVVPPYDDPDYMDYAKLNWARMNRWLKRSELVPETKELFASLQQTQKWIVITEPWCGDAAHSVPFFHLLAETNPQITLEIELRDQPPLRIEQYLTNGTKSIPKLVVRDAEGKDLFTWGPRPQVLQELFVKLKEEGHGLDHQKEVMQKWYNEDKGQSVQQELTALLRENTV